MPSEAGLARGWFLEAGSTFVEQPQTNGVAERFDRTLREQVLAGRIFRDLGEVPAGVARFVERYDQHRRLEKLGHRSPVMARLDCAAGIAA